jgi:hypothetical protein
MTERRIEELANEAAMEAGATVADFEIDHVEKTKDSLKITLAWRAPLRLEITFDLHDYDTDDSVKAEVRRQIRAINPGNPPQS